MQLDDAYANAAHIPGAETYPPRWAAQALAFRDGLGGRAELDRPYGDAPREVFDLFHPEGPARGCVIFVHGGYWKAFDKSAWSHLAAGPLARSNPPAICERALFSVPRKSTRWAVEGPLSMGGSGDLFASARCSDRPLAW